MKTTVPLSRHLVIIQRRVYSSNKNVDPDHRDSYSNQYHSIPNYITVSRILASPLLTYAIINDYKASALTGVVAFAFSDWLDGYLAKKLKQQTTIGAFLDPLADKFMVGTLAIGLAWKGLIPVELCTLILSRDIFLTTCAVMLRLIEKPTNSGFWDVNSATFRVQPNFLSKVNTGVQFCLLSLTLSNYGFGFPPTSLLEPLWWLTATTTFCSWVGYLDGSGIKPMELKQKAQEKARTLMKKKNPFL